MTDIGKLKDLRERALTIGSADAWDAYDIALRQAAPSLIAECERLRADNARYNALWSDKCARLEAAERVVAVLRDLVDMPRDTRDWLGAIDALRAYDNQVKEST